MSELLNVSCLFCDVKLVEIAAVRESCLTIILPSLVRMVKNLNLCRVVTEHCWTHERCLSSSRLGTSNHLNNTNDILHDM